jgi:purine-binding chemotaxis protein CheW
VGDQEFTVPTVIVQEVIHYSVPVKLPIAPPFVAGVINLRGKVTPLVHLRDILEIQQKTKHDDRFIVICRYQGLQIGLIIERVHSMYRVTQKDIDWGIEAHLGINVDYVSGLLKQKDQLIGIIAVDKIVTDLLSDDKKQ